MVAYLCMPCRVVYSFNVSNLEVGLNYTFAVAAVTIGTGPFSTPVVAVTFPDRPAASPNITAVRVRHLDLLGPTPRNCRFAVYR